MSSSLVNSFLFFMKKARLMKIIFQIYYGVNVHKSFLVTTIIKTTGDIEPSYRKKRFSTFNNSIIKFK